MTLGEFHKAQEDDSFVIKIRKHKTLITHGHRNIVLSPSLHQWMNVIVSKFTWKCTYPRYSRSIFTLNSRPMGPSAVGCQIGSCWAKVFGKEAGGATAFPKGCCFSCTPQWCGAERTWLAWWTTRSQQPTSFIFLKPKLHLQFKPQSIWANWCMVASPQRQMNLEKLPTII